MLCYRCGSHVPDDSASCTSCGQRFDLETPRGGASGLRRKTLELEGTGFAVGAILAGRYEVRAALGRGPLGTVFRVFDKETDTEVALKLIHPQLFETGEQRLEFQRAMKQAKRLTQSNVLRAYDCGLTEIEGQGPTGYFTAQLLDGITLRRVIDLRVEKGHFFSLKEVEPILAQAALALDHAHEVGPHGDLKPENIIILPDLLKLTDFGVTASLPRQAFVAAQRGAQAGSYLAPELAEGLLFDGRADTYALGVLLGEMLAGVRPTEERPPVLLALAPELPPGVQVLYQRALSHDPNDRFAKAGELAAEVLGLLGPPPPVRAEPVPALWLTPPPLAEERPTRPAAPPADLLLRSQRGERGQDEIPTAVGGAARDARGSSPVDAAADGIPTSPGIALPHLDARPPRTTPFYPGPVRPMPRRSLLVPIAIGVLALVPAALGARELLRGWRGRDRTHVQASHVPRVPPPPDAGTEPPAPVVVLAPDAGEDAGPIGDAAAVVAVATPPPPSLPAVCPSGMQLVPAGTSDEGTPPDDELENFGDRKRHRVTLRSYCIDRYEYPGQPKTTPMTGVAFPAAKAECEKQEKRLCSEDEWERGCKGPENRRFPYGQRFDPKACNAGARALTLTPVGAFAHCVSGYGLFDMSGNAAEWTASRFQPGTADRVIKGGSVDRPDTDLRCTARQNRAPQSHSPLLGFRCCADPR